METRPRRAVIIRNPRARRAPAVRELLRAAGPLRDGGWEVEGRDTSAPGEATELAAAAAGAGADVVIACGGDGTVHEVMNGLAGTETALAVAPAGTADVWAREARLPRDPAAAMALLPHARRRAHGPGRRQRPPLPAHVRHRPGRRGGAADGGAATSEALAGPRGVRGGGGDGRAGRARGAHRDRVRGRDGAPRPAAGDRRQHAPLRRRRPADRRRPHRRRAAGPADFPHRRRPRRRRASRPGSRCGRCAAACTGARAAASTTGEPRGWW